ncbi:hypothetical protein WB401_04400 [Streptomyces brasiliscabiei]|uniref:Uncharacterized protein n=1 Tax=Streptomyces brasiliscabiei TaxID=2736302 RepID=A0ABU8GMZ8_9ACTN
MPVPTPDLVKARFPSVSVKGELGDRTPLLSNEAAKQRLGFHPQHSWRDHVSAES